MYLDVSFAVLGCGTVPQMPMWQAWVFSSDPQGPLCWVELTSVSSNFLCTSVVQVLVSALLRHLHLPPFTHFHNSKISWNYSSLWKVWGVGRPLLWRQDGCSPSAASGVVGATRSWKAATVCLGLFPVPPEGILTWPEKETCEFSS